VFSLCLGAPVQEFVPNSGLLVTQQEEEVEPEPQGAGSWAEEGGRETHREGTWRLWK
jgi:hypothetical protein